MTTFYDDPNAPAGTGETTSMAADDKGMVTVPADQWRAYQDFIAAQSSPPGEFTMTAPDPATAAAFNAPSRAAATEATGQVPDVLPIPVAQAPLPTDTDTLVRELLGRIARLEKQAQDQAAAAGVPTNPVEAAFRNLHDHVSARAAASPTLESLQSLAKSVKTAFEDVKAGRVVDDKTWGNLKLDVESLTDLFRTHELTYLPELVRNVERARLNS